jgi:hypothetical protein
MEPLAQIFISIKFFFFIWSYTRVDRFRSELYSDAYTDSILLIKYFNIKETL